MRRLLPLVIALTLLGLPACSHENDADPAPEPARASDQPEWQRLPDFPLAERDGPVVVWTGSEVLAVGGDVGEPCPPNASCVKATEAATDGAALDPATRTWRRIADAPRQIAAYNRGVVVAGRLFIRVDESLLSYDVARDRWTTLPRRISGWYDLVADGDRLVLVSGSDEDGKRADLAYSPDTDEWSDLPDDPLGPSFGRSMVSTPYGLLLGAHALVASPGGGARPSYVEAALLQPDGTWREFGVGEWTGGFDGALGDRAIGLSLATSDGGGDPPGDYGRQVPAGGRLDLRTGAWSALPQPAERSTGWGVYAPDGRLMASEGYVYDDLSGTWLQVPQPTGASEQPGPAVWAGEELIVVTALAAQSWTKEARSNEAWSWTPVLR
ncbi:MULTISPECIES: hypothetical protein [unclassified Nocardioides]|uniref:hypothetical protein n=1 Tax=unclassified Nocardioides TaxID=2615069 RepID=UPI0006F7749C|nr:MULTISPECIES: hypothetical protein [unclassified Nocardioides]KRA38412.1 hypothetical protein ASD81_07200 [Nocardioides sp. Root614]KRA92371.1 hypothetical protein ASD84_07465 [Nocardioides sp. Root682]